MKSFSTKQKGFTLVELLIVIAIIGILVTILVVSLRQAADRSRNTKTIAGVVQIRRVAAEMYAEELLGYTSLCDSGNLNSAYHVDLDVLKKDIEASGGIISCYAGLNSYCISSSLRTAGEFVCIDDEGNNVQVTGNPCTDASDVCQ